MDTYNSIHTDLYPDYFAANQLAHHRDIYHYFYNESKSNLLLLAPHCFGRNYHPPFATLLFLPFITLPFRVVLCLWLLSSLFFLGLALFIIKQELLPRFSRKAILISLVILVYSPTFFENMWSENFSIMLFLLIVLAWRAARRGQQVRAGIYLAVATCIKLTPALLLIYLAWKRQWRALLAACCTAGTLLLIPLPWLSLQVYTRYFTQIAPVNASCWGSDFTNLTFAGFISHVFPPDHLGRFYAPPTPLDNRLTILASCILLLICFWLLTRHVASSRVFYTAYLDCEWGLVCVVMLLISPLTWTHALIFLCLPLALLLQWSQHEPEPWKSRYRVGMSIVVLLLFLSHDLASSSLLLLPLTGYLVALLVPLTGQASLWQILTLYSAQFYGMLILFVMCAWYRTMLFSHLTLSATPDSPMKEKVGAP